jgi:hypothetical protein
LRTEITSFQKFHTPQNLSPLTGFFFTDGSFWVEQRRFSLRHLRDFGFGKKSLEVIIMDEAEELIKRLQPNDVQVSTYADSCREALV